MNHFSAVAEYAKMYVRAGLSVIPIRPDGSRRPAVADVDVYSTRRATDTELKCWADTGTDIAIMGGAISGGLEILTILGDTIDREEAPWLWITGVNAAAPKLRDRLVHVVTPQNELHVYFRCTAIGAYSTLARIPDRGTRGRTPKTISKSIGERAYIIAPPSPSVCTREEPGWTLGGHRNLTQICTILPAERALLVQCARKLNRWEEPDRSIGARRLPSLGPDGDHGADFNRSATWAQVLMPYGLVWVSRDRNGTDHWRRSGDPGNGGVMTNVAGADLLYASGVHPFEDGLFYSKFAADALLKRLGHLLAEGTAKPAEGNGGLGRQLAVRARRGTGASR